MNAKPGFQSHDFPDPMAQAAALADRIAKLLRDALAARGTATLAVSGGTTPKALFRHLAQEALDWSRVGVTLVDERWVPDTDPRSNARLVHEHLLQHAARTARFVPLYTGAATPQAGLAAAEAALATLAQPFDAIVLGMGEDGHTASFFPGGDHLAAALDPAGQARVLPMQAPGAGEPRITLTLPPIAAAHAAFLLVTGQKKRELLEAVRLGKDGAADYPIAALARALPAPLAVYWSP